MTLDGADPRQPGDRSVAELDGELDRDELKGRYYGLMQELRVLLPGVQVLVAFLLTVPFASQFDQLDDVGRNLFGISLVSATCAVIVLMTPIALHRYGRRRDRVQRLEISIRLTRVGIALLGVALLTALFVVARFVYGRAASLVLPGIVALLMLALWVGVPVRTRHDDR